MNAISGWKFLVRKPKSAYKQLFVKDRWIAARTLYGQTVGEDARTPQEVAQDYQLALEVVLEAIAYCQNNPPEIREDWEREQTLIHPGSNGDAAGQFDVDPPRTSPAPNSHEAVS